MRHCVLQYFLTLSFFCIFAITASAQANADAAFKQGQSYQQTMTIAAQDKAIERFVKAKKMYDAAKDKKKCDNAIQVSVNIKKKLRNSGGNTNRNRNRHGETEEVRESVQSVLGLSNNYFKLESDPKTVSVTVTTKNDSWEANAISGSDGTNFVTVQKRDDDSFDIICEKNSSTKKRYQKVEVTTGNYKKVIVVEQQGVPIILRLGENLWECSWKGGDKTIGVYCNSETTVKDNNEQNWRVESKPDWVSVTFATKKKQGLLEKAGSLAKKLVKGEVDVNDDPTLKQTMVNIVVEKLKNGTSEFTSGRKGEIIFVSDNQRATLMVVQNGK